MVVRVAADFRGELSLAPVGFPIKANSIVNLREDQFYSSEVQLAVQKGWLTVEGEFTFDAKKSATGKFHVKNISGQPLSAGDVSFEVGETKFITERQFNQTDLQNAIKLELVKPVEVPVQPVEASSKKKKTGKSKKQDQSESEPYRPEEPETTIQAWDARREKAVSKDKIKQSYFKEIEPVAKPKSDNPDVQVGEIDFTVTEETKKKSVKTSRAKSRLKKTAKKASKARKTKSKKTKANTLKPVGRQRPPASPDGDPLIPDQLPNEIGFVDQEQTAERIRKHPKLSERLTEIIDIEI